MKSGWKGEGGVAARRHEVVWAPAARDDLDDVVRRIEDESPSQAARILHLIRARAQALELFPSRCRVVPEVKEWGVTSYRELIVSPWRIVFRIEAGTIWVVAVVDGRRDMEEVLLQRLIGGME